MEQEDAPLSKSLNTAKYTREYTYSYHVCHYTAAKACHALLGLWRYHCLTVEAGWTFEPFEQD